MAKIDSGKGLGQIFRKFPNNNRSVDTTRFSIGDHRLVVPHNPKPRNAQPQEATTKPHQPKAFTPNPTQGIQKRVLF
jgi:hypothetical protein